MLRFKISALLSGWICLAAFATLAGEVPEQDITKVDADFAVQGEYAGDLTSADGTRQKLGAQIIACGKGEFHAVFYPGGLPGEGWNGKTKIEKAPAKEGNVPVDTKRDGDKTVVDSVYKAVISGDSLSGQTDKGEKFELRKVLRKSPTLELKAPPDALVLFDGTSVDKVTKGRMTEDKLLMEDVYSKDKLGSGTWHVEFRLPYLPTARGQGRGNSGVYMQSRFETQIVDSFGLEGKHNECGGIYSVKAPDVNMCFPPLSWQTYDIDFTAAQYDGGKKVKNAVISEKHNGVVIHKDVEVPHATTAAPKQEGPDLAPLYLQGHGNPVRFRNVWFVEKK
jgi:hypothetical protein